MATVLTSEHTARELTRSEVFASLPPAVVAALVEQKDDVITGIARATTLDELRAAVLSFRLVAVLWSQLGYDYKAAEVRRRIVERAGELARLERAEAAMFSPRAVAKKGAAYFRADALEAFAASL